MYQFSRELTLESYKITKQFPNEEKFAMVQQIRRAALSVHLNVAEGCSRKSVAERNRFFEIARGSVIEVDAAVGVAYKLSYITAEELQTIGDLIIKSFKILSAMINRNNTDY
ncbi:MAG: four helix bundle protein [Ferruginibacter sp.]